MKSLELTRDSLEHLEGAQFHVAQGACFAYRAILALQQRAEIVLSTRDSL